MDVRTFEAFTLRDALKLVKAEFGKEAVILGTREKPGTKGEKIFEVTAAAQAVMGAAIDSRRPTSNHDPLIQHLPEMVHSLAMRLDTLQQNLVSRDHLMGIEAGLRELKVLMGESLRSGKSETLFAGVSEPIAAVARQLLLMGVDETLLGELVRHLAALPEGDNGVEPLGEAMKSQAIRWLVRRVKIAPRWDNLGGSQTVHVFVGPTGVGKSASVAKLAAMLHLREHKKILVVSFDKLRLAAAEQMRVYTKILGVDFEILNEPGDLLQLLSAYREHDLVLLDTGGLSPKNATGVESLLEFKQLDLVLDFHLVLSLTEKGEQLDRAVRAFAPLGLRSLVFTKLDEAWTYGEIVNMGHRWGLALSYFGIGQGIPDDLERASRERVVERVFGL